MASRYILSFDEASLKDIRLLGGKGANLAELYSAGFPVPWGFGINSIAFEDFLRANQFDSVIPKLVEEIDFRDARQISEVTSGIRRLITTAPIPVEIISEISDTHKKFKAGTAVAVRSSSMVPGQDRSSFPGQMDTFYHVVGLPELLEKVKKCWASFWTVRAAMDRWNKGIDHFAVKISALVQEMIPSEFSGVAFTMNPVSGEDQYVIEAIQGLGDALVSGKVNPHLFLLTKDPLTITEQPRVSPVSRDLILEVANLSGLIERHYGKPQDIEWASAAGSLYVLQSRDVVLGPGKTVDYAGLEKWNKKAECDESAIIWTRAWSDEVLTRAITPLFYSVQAELITATYDFIYRCYGLTGLLPLKLMRFHKNRGYFSTRYLRECLRYVPKSLRDDEVLKFFTPAQKEEVKSVPFLAAKKLASEIRLLLLHRKYSFNRCYKTYYGQWRPELLRRVRELDSLDLNSASLEQLEAYFRGMDRLIKEHCRPVGFGVMVHTAGVITFLGKILEKWYGDRTVISGLLAGIPGNYTAQTNEATWLLSRQIKRSPVLFNIFCHCPAGDIVAELGKSGEGKAFREQMERFRQDYAFRGAEDREISFPRWGDGPDQLIDILKIFVQTGDENEPGASGRRNQAQRGRLTRAVSQTLARQRWGRLKAITFRFLLKHAQIYSLFRENQRYDIDRVFYGERKAFLAISRHLARDGVIRESDDVWFLSKEEVFDAAYGKLSGDEVRKLIVPRKAEYRRYLLTPPALFLQGAREFEADSEVTDRADIANAPVLKGVAASSGKAQGIARVVHSMSELNRIKPGDILVTNSTDPGWTPVFLLIRGLVLETGGILAHGTVLSREYGLPAVTSVSNATGLIRDGTLIAIDGSLGTISLNGQQPGVGSECGDRGAE